MANVVRGEAARMLAALTALIGFGFSACLTIASVTVIEATCQWWLPSLALMTLLALTCSLRLLRSRRAVRAGAGRSSWRGWRGWRGCEDRVVDPRVLAAAANNARWCDVVCRSHGLPTVMSQEIWIAPEGSPRFYPDAVTLAPGLTADAVLSGIDDGPGSSVKDSFADVELGDRGFEVLFGARWLVLESAVPRRRPRLDWRAVATGADFAAWVGAAGLEGVLPLGVLDDPTVSVLVAGGRSPGTAGAVVHATGGVVGVSNVFTAGISAEVVWSDLPAVVRTTAGDLPVVGYEHGDALDQAVASGFTAIGALRVWMKPSA